MRLSTRPSPLHGQPLDRRSALLKRMQQEASLGIADSLTVQFPLSSADDCLSQRWLAISKNDPKAVRRVQRNELPVKPPRALQAMIAAMAGPGWAGRSAGRSTGPDSAGASVGAAAARALYGSLYAGSAGAGGGRGSGSAPPPVCLLRHKPGRSLRQQGPHTKCLLVCGDDVADTRVLKRACGCQCGRTTQGLELTWCRQGTHSMAQCVFHEFDIMYVP